MEMVPVAMGDRSYEIIIEAGSLGRTGEYVRSRVSAESESACVVTSRTVADLYLETVSDSLIDAGFRVSHVILPDGEEFKTIDTFTEIITRLIEDRFERKSVIVPLGGGVVGDIAGFVAASYLRGIPFVQVPTSIVAQVDSSIGGKVAVNHALGKNLIGAFYQPLGVWIDTRVLATLAPREVVSGMAEAVKHGIIRDSEYFTFLEEHVEAIMNFTAPDEVMERFIAWNCRIKAEVVAEDEREGGIRALLNYGHTVGHALETVTGYGRFTHGEAVILGMIAAGRISVMKGLLSEEDFVRQNRLLGRVGINTPIGSIETHDLHRAMSHDKKVSRGVIKFILADGTGSARICDTVSHDEIEAGMTYMLEHAHEITRTDAPTDT
jgi:3-dehydroquinate synthase